MPRAGWRRNKLLEEIADMLTEMRKTLLGDLRQ